MKRLVMMAVAVGATIAATAMPTRKDLAKAQEMVADVTAADVAALKAGTKKPAEVAAKHMELAGQAGSEAEKYLLLQGAFRLFVKGEDYENAAKAIETMQTEIKDFNPEVIVELCGKAFVRKMQENAPRLYALKENARRIVFYRRQLPIREAAVRKNPLNGQAQRKLAECHAELGNWPKALEVFVKAGGEFKKISEGETSGKIPAQELGDFWWDYETKSDTQVYKLHAAELYRKAIADDSFKGLARTRAEQRAKEVEASGIDLPQVIAGGVAQTGETGLAHRWSFTKDFVDSVGKVEAKKLGKSVKLEKGQCVVRQGGLDMGDVLRKIDIPFTVELWCTKIGDEYASRVLRADQIEVDAKECSINWVPYGERVKLMDFTIDHRCYVAVTYDGRQLSTYAYDFDGENQLHTNSVGSASISFADRNLWLGVPCSYPDEAVMKKWCHKFTSAMYDEVRIWRVCKSKEDIEASIKAGPDRVVIPKVQPALVADRAIASGKAPTPKCKMINGRPAPLKFELAKGVDLELEGCPAGTFTMGYKKCDWRPVKNAASLHNVRITRPFWIGKFQLTRGQFKQMGVDLMEDEELRKGFNAMDDKDGLTCAAFITYHMAQDFLFKLNSKFIANLPKGYTFRLPTDAEWEYASKASDYSEANVVMKYADMPPYYAVFGLMDDDRVALMKKGGVDWTKHWAVPPGPVGLKKANAWGIYDMVGNTDEMLLDQVSLTDSQTIRYSEKYKGVIVGLKCIEGDADPLLLCDDGSGVLVRGATLLKVGRPRDAKLTFRVCLGPDLVAEKKAKGK